ncbi:MAG: glycosyltransferase family 2 protein [Anaerolineaceae bacterium]
MTTYPRVSIVTPSFNQVTFLERTILSVLNQDYPLVEYWVVDGGSTDGSVKLIDKYSKHLAGWMSEKDRGQAEGINKGLALVTGDIIAWLNSDDVYLPETISRAVEAFARHPEASFVYSDVDSIDANDRIFHRMRYGHWGLTELMQFDIIGQPAVFMRRQALEQAGWLDLSYHYLLDHHLWLRLAVVGRPFYIKGEPLAQARFHKDAKNVAAAANFGPEAFRIAKWLGEDERFYPMNAKLHHKIWAGAYRLNAYYLVEAGRNSEALGMYAQAFKRSPRLALKDWKRIALALPGEQGSKIVRKPVDFFRRLRYRRTKATK